MAEAPKRPVYWLMLFVGCAGIAVLAASIGNLIQHPIDVGLGFRLVLLVVLGSQMRVRLARVQASLSTIAETFLITTVFMCGAGGGALAAFVSAAVVAPRYRYHGALGGLRLVFNLSASPLAIWIAAHWVLGGAPLVHAGMIDGTLVGRVAVFAALYFMLATAPVAIVVALQTAASPFMVWSSGFRDLALSYASAAALATVIVVFGANLAVVGLVLPILAVMYTNSYWQLLAAERQKMREITELQEKGSLLTS